MINIITLVSEETSAFRFFLHKESIVMIRMSYATLRSQVFFSVVFWCITWSRRFLSCDPLAERRPWGTGCLADCPPQGRCWIPTGCWSSSVPPTARMRSAAHPHPRCWKRRLTKVGSARTRAPASLQTHTSTGLVQKNDLSPPRLQSQPR